MYFIAPDNCQLVSLDLDTMVETPIVTATYIGFYSVVENKLFVADVEGAKLDYKDTSIPAGPDVNVLDYYGVSEIEQLELLDNIFVQKKLGKILKHNGDPVTTSVTDLNFSTLGEGFLKAVDFYGMYIVKLTGTLNGHTMHPLPVCKFHDTSIEPPD